MAPPKKPAPEAELAAVRTVAEQLADVEREAARLRAVRNAEILAAKLAGATGDQLAAAALIKRQNVHAVLSEAGYNADLTPAVAARLVERLRRAAMRDV
ncbi:hypothetical protein [Actinokineospora sp.]|uniref:hypothetical protein n=1 Tax=Actinokineospora sp. TaxID=1872133 RepID=UPI003D6C5BCE